MEFIGLAEAVAVLREELAKAREAGVGEDVAFTVGPVEVEFAVVAKRNAGVRAGVQFGVVTVGANGGIAREQTHRVKVTLTPTDAATKASLEISDRTTTIPDR